MSQKIGNIFLRFKKNEETESEVHLACTYEVPEEMLEKVTDDDIVSLIKQAIARARRKLEEVNIPYSAETCAKFLYIDIPLVFVNLDFWQDMVEILCDHLYYIDVEAEGYDRSFTLRGYRIKLLEGKKTKAFWTDLYLLPDAYQRLAEEFDQEVEAIVL